MIAAAGVISYVLVQGKHPFVTHNICVAVLKHDRSRTETVERMAQQQASRNNRDPRQSNN